MRRANRLHTRCAAILLACVLLALSAACGDSGEDWITTDSTATTASGGTTATTVSSEFSGDYTAPVFRTGRYKMVSTSINNSVYKDGVGTTLYSDGTMTRYTYILDITVSDAGIVCRYTFSEIYGTSTEDGEESVVIDTTNSSLKDSTTQVFYDLIGRSFSASAGTNGVLSGVTGISDIVADVPDAATLISDDLMYSMASDLFYSMPSVFTTGTSWMLTQHGVTNTYSLSRMSRGSFGVSIIGSELTLPDPVTDADGYTTTFSSMLPLSGFLWLDQTDRAVQELTSYQRSEGMFANDEGYGAYFTLTATSSCTIQSIKK